MENTLQNLRALDNAISNRIQIEVAFMRQMKQKFLEIAKDTKSVKTGEISVYELQHIIDRLKNATYILETTEPFGNKVVQTLLDDIKRTHTILPATFLAPQNPAPETKPAQSTPKLPAPSETKPAQNTPKLPAPSETKPAQNTPKLPAPPAQSIFTNLSTKLPHWVYHKQKPPPDQGDVDQWFDSESTDSTDSSSIKPYNQYDIDMLADLNYKIKNGLTPEDLAELTKKVNSDTLLPSNIKELALYNLNKKYDMQVIIDKLQFYLNFANDVKSKKKEYQNLHKKVTEDPDLIIQGDRFTPEFIKNVEKSNPKYADNLIIQRENTLRLNQLVKELTKNRGGSNRKNMKTRKVYTRRSPMKRSNTRYEH